MSLPAYPPPVCRPDAPGSTIGSVPAAPTATAFTAPAAPAATARSVPVSPSEPGCSAELLAWPGEPLFAAPNAPFLAW